MQSYIGTREFSDILLKLEEKGGMALGPEKAYLLDEKLGKLVAEMPPHSFPELHGKICFGQDSALLDRLVESMTINETFWFRDKSPWTMLEEVLLPRWIEEMENGKRHRVRIWSAACSFGQEPYSIAMCVASHLKRSGADNRRNTFEIIATDISRPVIRMAEKGAYDGIAISRGLEDTYRDLYFEKAGNAWSLRDEIRQMVRFHPFNLIADPYGFEPFDVIFCRNVMIYFSDARKRQVCRSLAETLTDGGILFIGSAELMEDCENVFSRNLHKGGVFFRKQTVSW